MVQRYHYSQNAVIGPKFLCLYIGIVLRKEVLISRKCCMPLHLIFLVHSDECLTIKRSVPTPPFSFGGSAHASTIVLVQGLCHDLQNAFLGSVVLLPASVTIYQRLFLAAFFFMLLQGTCEYLQNAPVEFVVLLHADLHLCAIPGHV